MANPFDADLDAYLGGSSPAPTTGGGHSGSGNPYDADLDGFLASSGHSAPPPPPEPGILSKAWHGVENVLGAPSRAVMAGARGIGHLEGIDIPEDLSSGAAIREAAGLSPDPLISDGNNTIGRRLAGGGVEFLGGLAADPTTYLLGGAGKLAGAGKAAEAFIGAREAAAAAEAADAIRTGQRAALVGRGAAAAFVPGMAEGAIRGAQGAYQGIQSGDYPGAAEAALGAGLSSAFALGAGRHAFVGEHAPVAPEMRNFPADTVAPPVEAPAPAPFAVPEQPFQMPGAEPFAPQEQPFVPPEMVPADTWQGQMPPGFEPPTPAVDIARERDFLRPDPTAAENTIQAAMARRYLSQRGLPLPEEPFEVGPGHELEPGPLGLPDQRGVFQGEPPEGSQPSTPFAPLLENIGAPAGPPRLAGQPLVRYSDAARAAIPETGPATPDMGTIDRGTDRRLEPASTPLGQEPPVDRQERRLAARRAALAEKYGVPEDDPLVAEAAQAQHDARTDPLTGLGNKRVAQELVQDLKDNPSPDKHALAIDLKKFKAINDVYGHDAGDAVLQVVSGILEKHLGEDAARPGGDEFLGVMKDATLDQAHATARAIQDDLAQVAHVTLPDGSQVDIPGIQAHIGIGRTAHEADTQANLIAAESRKGGRGALPSDGSTDAGTAGGVAGGGQDNGLLQEEGQGGPLAGAPEVAGRVASPADVAPPDFRTWARANGYEFTGDRHMAQAAQQAYLEAFPHADREQFRPGASGGRVSPAFKEPPPEPFVNSAEAIERGKAEVAAEVPKDEAERSLRESADLIENLNLKKHPGLLEDLGLDDLGPKKDLVEAIRQDGNNPTYLKALDQHRDRLAEHQQPKYATEKTDREPVKIFQRYDSDQRANRAASFRLFPGQREAVGEFFWQHPDIPDRGFPTRAAAIRAAEARRAEKPTSHATEITKAGEQNLIPGTLDAAASGPGRPTEGREARGPLFTQESDRLTRETKAREDAAQGTLKFKAGEGPTLPGITREHVEQAFPSGKVTEAPEGHWDVALPGDRNIRVRITPDGIEFNPEAFKAGYGRDISGAEKIVGSWQRIGRDGLISLAKEADASVLSHESFHAAMDVALSAKEKAAVLEKYGNEEAAAEAYARWEPAKSVNGWWSKILSFAKRLYRTFAPSWESAFERTRSGEAFGSGETSALEGGVQRFATAAKAVGDKVENFKRWFGDSKVVDEKGEPQVVYHGTDRNFNKFNPRKATMGGIHWFTSDKSAIEAGDVGAQGRGKVMDLYASIKNPAGWDEYNKFGLGELKSRGYDGAILPEKDGTFTGFVFEPEQFKSASKNVGTYDPSNADIRYATAAKLPDEEPAPSEPKDNVREFKVGSSAPGGRPPFPEEAPQVEHRVEGLREAEQGAGAEESTLSRDAPRTWESLDPKIQQILRKTPEKTLLSKAAKGNLDDAEVQAMAAVVKGKAETMETARAELGRARDAGEDDGAANSRYLSASLDYIAAERAHVQGGTETARALAARARIMDAGANVPHAFLKQVFREIPGISDKQAAGLLDVFLKEPGNLPDAIRAAMKPTLFQKFLEFWKAGLVSAPGTQVANIFGNSLEQGARIGETITSALIDKALGGERRNVGSAGAELHGAMSQAPKATSLLWSDIKDAFTLAPEGLDVTGGKFEHQIGKIGGKTGRAVRIPFRLLTAADNWFKSVGAGAELGKLSHQEALRELGPKASPAQIEAKAEQIRKNPPKEMLAKVEAARFERTYQEDPGKLAQSIISARANVPYLNVIAPFVKTPANILNRAFQRSPIGFFKAETRAALSEFSTAKRAFADGKISKAAYLDAKGNLADALARPTLGFAMIGSFAAMGMAGGLTGSGPVDPKKKNLLLDTGWQPYSFVVNMDGKKVYVPFNRFEPMSTGLQIVADAMEIKDQKKVGDMLNKAVGSFVKDVLSKSYLQGPIDFANFASNPQTFASQYVTGLAGSLVPNIVSKGAQAFDPTLRDTSARDSGIPGIPERLGKTFANRIPGLSNTLPAKMSAVGEPIEKPGIGLTRFASPIQVTSDREGPGYDVEREMARVGGGPGNIPNDLNIKGTKIPLEPEEQQKFALARQMAADQLAPLIKSPRWQSLPDTIDGAMGGPSKEGIIRTAYERANSAAHQAIFAMPSFRTRARGTLVQAVS